MTITGRLGVTAAMAFVVGNAFAGDAGDRLSVAQRSLEKGRYFIEICDYHQAEDCLRSALHVADTSGDQEVSPGLHAVRMQSLRMLTRMYYPHMRNERWRDALRTGLRYQYLLRESEAIQSEAGACCLCENALHLAKAYMFRGMDAKAEVLLQGVRLSETVSKRRPDLALDVWLHRADLARRLARSQQQAERREQWTQTSRERWLQVEHYARGALSRMATDEPSHLRTLARRYRPVLTAGELPRDAAVAELRELLQRSETLEGPEAVLRLIRLYARTDRLQQADMLARGLLEHCQETPPKNPILLPKLRNQLGAIEGTRGKFVDAAAQYQQAIHACQRLCSEAAATLTPQILELLAVAHDELGCLAAAQGDYRAAIDKSKLAMEHWGQLALHDAYHTRAARGRVRTRFHRASIAKAQGRHPDAIREYKAVTALIVEVCGPDCPDLIEPKIALAEAHLAGRRLDETHLEKAEEHARQAARIAKICGDHLGGRMARHVLAQVDFRRGQVDTSTVELDKAQATWIELLREHRNTGNRLWEGRILRRLGDIQRAKDNPKQAKKLYVESIACLDRFAAPPITRFNPRMMLAQVLAAEDRFPEATTFLKQAIRIVEVAGASCNGTENQQVQFYEQFNEAYDLLVKCLLEDERSDVESALFYADKFRNHILWDELQRSNSGIHPVKSLPSSVRRRFDADFAVLQRKLNALHRRQRQRVMTVEEVEQLESHEGELLRLWSDARDANPYYRKLLPPRSTREHFHQQVSRLVQQGDVILYYYVGDTESYLCVITDEKERYFRLAISLQLANVLFDNPPDEPIPLTCPLAVQLVDRYVNVLQNKRRSWQLDRGSGGSSDETNALAEADDGPVRGFTRVPVDQLPNYRRCHIAAPSGLRMKRFGYDQAVALSEVLLPASVLQEIGEIHPPHVIIVADPALSRLPFQALPVKNKDGAAETAYVIDRFPATYYAPSIGVLSLLRSRSDNQRSSRVVLSAGGATLEKAYDECCMFADLFGDGVVRPQLIGLRATEPLLRGYLPRCGLFHFAGHAFHNERTDNLTGGLALHQSQLLQKLGRELPPDNDGQLSLMEIHDLDLRGLELVILCACRSGSGVASERTRLDNGRSLARAFLVAGSPRVIGTFWDVADGVPLPVMREVAAQIAERFANHQTIDYAAALHEAMKKTREDRRGGTTAPYHWAFMGLVGAPVADHGRESPHQTARR